MKTILRASLLLFTVLFIVSCSSDDSVIDDPTNPGGTTQKVMKLEIIPEMDNPEDYEKVNILLTINSENENIDMEGAEYTERDIYGEYKKTFDYDLEVTDQTIELESTDEIYGPGINLLLLGKENASTTTHVYTVKLYANNELISTEELYLKEGNVSQHFNPVINWDFIE